MVLRPILEFDVWSDLVPAWTAIERRQTASAESWWLITQPDHAALSGEIARHFSCAGFPQVDAQAASTIAGHDSGWDLFESDLSLPPPTHPDGRPVAFFEVAPADFLRAWRASVDRAAEHSAMGGYLVSRHFSWLGEYRLGRVEDPPPVRAQLAAFVQQERRRQTELTSSCDTGSWEALLTVLQFCDLFSLYLCSGARQPVEFPQEFAAGRVHARFDGDVCVLSPTPLSEKVTLTLAARRYPADPLQPDAVPLTFAVK